MPPLARCPIVSRILALAFMGALPANPSKDVQMTSRDKERVFVLVRRLFRALALTGKCTDNLSAALQRWPELGGPDGPLANLLGSRPEDPTALFNRPITDPGAATVTWHGRTCKLGQSLLFRLMDRLARRPGHYLSFDRLVRDVWEGHMVSDEAIRSAVRHLKRRLKQASMRGLAVAIRSDRRHYFLDLESRR